MLCRRQTDDPFVRTSYSQQLTRKRQRHAHRIVVIRFDLSSKHAANVDFDCVDAAAWKTHHEGHNVALTNAEAGSKAPTKQDPGRVACRQAFTGNGQLFADP